MKNYVYYDLIPYRILNMSHKETLDWIRNNIKWLVESNTDDIDPCYSTSIPSLVRVQTEDNRNYFYVVLWHDNNTLLSRLSCTYNGSKYKPIDLRKEF